MLLLRLNFAQQIFLQEIFPKLLCYILTLEMSRWELRGGTIIRGKINISAPAQAVDRMSAL